MAQTVTATTTSLPIDKDQRTLTYIYQHDKTATRLVLANFGIKPPKITSYSGTESLPVDIYDWLDKVDKTLVVTGITDREDQLQVVCKYLYGDALKWYKEWYSKHPNATFDDLYFTMRDKFGASSPTRGAIGAGAASAGSGASSSAASGSTEVKKNQSEKMSRRRTNSESKSETKKKRFSVSSLLGVKSSA